MRSELHRYQVTDAQTIRENLRDAAYHEAGHVVVARFLGLPIGRVEIEEDGSGRADIRYAEHLPLVDQIAIYVAGIEAQELFDCPMHQHAALGDYLKVRELLAGLTDAERYEYRHSNAYGFVLWPLQHASRASGSSKWLGRRLRGQGDLAARNDLLSASLSSSSLSSLSSLSLVIGLR